MSTSTLKIGWIGAGRMGAQLVTRLLDAGYDVTVYNRTASKAQHLADTRRRHRRAGPSISPTVTWCSAWCPRRTTSSR